MRPVLPLLVIACCSFGQTFEVASVKASPPSTGTRQVPPVFKGGPGTGDPGQITWNNLPLSWVLTRAYGIRNSQLSAPQWVDETRVDIAAKIPAGTSLQDFRAMLRNLLKERFHMQAHEETREATVYVLSTGKGAPKLEESKQTAAPEAPPPPESGKGIRLVNGFPPLAPGPGMASIMLNGVVKLSAQAQSMTQLAERLSADLDLEVQDGTGLTGLYDFHLAFMPDSSRAWIPPGGEPRPDAPVDVFTAVSQQLGLKLERRKGPVKTVILDSMEKTATEN